MLIDPAAENSADNPDLRTTCTTSVMMSYLTACKVTTSLTNPTSKLAQKNVLVNLSFIYLGPLKCIFVHPADAADPAEQPHSFGHAESYSR